MAGVVGFEPTDDGTKTRCLTTWLHPNKFTVIISYNLRPRQVFEHRNNRNFISLILFEFYVLCLLYKYTINLILAYICYKDVRFAVMSINMKAVVYLFSVFTSCALSACDSRFAYVIDTPCYVTHLLTIYHKPEIKIDEPEIMTYEEFKIIKENTRRQFDKVVLDESRRKINQPHDFSNTYFVKLETNSGSTKYTFNELIHDMLYKHNAWKLDDIYGIRKDSQAAKLLVLKMTTERTARHNYYLDEKAWDKRIKNAVVKIKPHLVELYNRMMTKIIPYLHAFSIVNASTARKSLLLTTKRDKEQGIRSIEKAPKK